MRCPEERCCSALGAPCRRIKAVHELDEPSIVNTKAEPRRPPWKHACMGACTRACSASHAKDRRSVGDGRGAAGTGDALVAWHCKVVLDKQYNVTTHSEVGLLRAAAP